MDGDKGLFLARKHEPGEAAGRRRRPLRIPIWQRIVFINVCGLVLFCAALLYFEDSRERYVALKGVELQLFGELLSRDAIECRAQAFRISCLIDLDRAKDLAGEFAREAGTRIRFVGQYGQPLADSFEISRTDPSQGSVRTNGDLANWRRGFSRTIDVLQRWPNADNPSMAYTVPEHAGPLGWRIPYGRTWEEEVFLALRTGQPTSAHRFQFRDGHASSVISAVSPIKDWNDRVLGAIVIASTSETIEAIVADERIKILWLMLAALAISITLSAALAHHIARPLSRLVSEANAITERRVALKEESLQVFWSLARYRSEIGTLALAHGKMVDSLRKRILKIKSDADTLVHRTGTKLSIVLTESHNLLTRDSQKIPDASLTQDQREYIQNILSAAQEASDTVNLILSQAVRDADAERSPREYFDLAKAVSEVVGEFDEEARRTQASIHFSDAGAGQRPFLGHQSQIKEVLRELLSNAISFTRPGGAIRVFVQLQRKRKGDTPSRFPVKLSVENDGDPIPDAIFPVIFEPGKTVRRGSGSHNGWGLWTVKRTLESIGGAIRAENIAPDVGKNAVRFTVSLP